MKYEVIGWTHGVSRRFKRHEVITASVDGAIIREIKKHGYCFGGDAHENYLPVLNDGTYADYSWRGWGAVMAQAHGGEQSDYMGYYMDELIAPEERKYPESFLVDTSRIRNRCELAETFKMHLADDMFQKMQSGIKTVEVRLFDEKRKRVDIDDFIEFENSKSERVKKRVKDMYLAKNFDSLLTRYDIESRADVFRYPPASLGMDENASLETVTEFMRRFYSEERESKFGAIAFILE